MLPLVKTLTPQLLFGAEMARTGDGAEPSAYASLQPEFVTNRQANRAPSTLKTWKEPFRTGEFA
jgi:hypothetical protein